MIENIINFLLVFFIGMGSVFVALFVFVKAILSMQDYPQPNQDKQNEGVDL